jgi:NAD(P)-dependent dehydrogenase (short-subunit alcohol dehydrogenase family)
MRDGPLAGRVAAVSGGGRGLGRSFCLALAREGAKVVVNNRNRVTDADGRGPADHVAGQIVAAGGEAVADHSDAADPAGGEAIVAAALERWGRLDICVANAAVGAGGMVHKQPAAQFGEVLEIGQLHALLAESGRGEPREFRVAVDAFYDLMGPGAS